MERSDIKTGRVFWFLRFVNVWHRIFANPPHHYVVPPAPGGELSLWNFMDQLFAFLNVQPTNRFPIGICDGSGRTGVQIPRPWRGGLMERSDIKTGRVFWCIRLAERLAQSFCQPSPPQAVPPAQGGELSLWNFMDQLFVFLNVQPTNRFPIGIWDGSGRTGVRISPPYVTVPALFAATSSAVAPFQITVIVFPTIPWSLFASKLYVPPAQV